MCDDQETIRGIRGAADMDHPWIPGAQAQLIRRAADLLERQQKELEYWRSPASIQTAITIGTWVKKIKQWRRSQQA